MTGDHIADRDGMEISKNNHFKAINGIESHAHALHSTLTCLNQQRHSFRAVAEHRRGTKLLTYTHTRTQTHEAHADTRLGSYMQVCA